jgi:hypothetical protein
MLEKGVRKMPKVGDKEFKYDKAGIAAAKKESAKTGMPISDGSMRSEKMYAGGGQTGYNKIGMMTHGGVTMDKKMMGHGGAMKDRMMYKDGGNTNDKKNVVTGKNYVKDARRSKSGPEGRRAQNIAKGTNVKDARYSKHGPEGKLSTDVKVRGTKVKGARMSKHGPEGKTSTNVKVKKGKK